MHVHELVDQLCLNALSGLIYGDKRVYGLTPEQSSKLLAAVNAGLIRICSKMPVMKDELILITQAHRTVYHLHSAHSMRHHPDDDEGYIDDRGTQPFCNEVVKILGVFDAMGREYKLNVKNEPLGLHVLGHDKLQVLRPKEGMPLSVIYQTQHPTVDFNSEILLPPQLVEALYEFSAYRIYSAMTGELHKLTANEHMSNFQRLTDETILDDLASTSETENSSLFDQRGFV